MASAIPASHRTVASAESQDRIYRPSGNASYLVMLGGSIALVAADLIAFMASLLVAALVAGQAGAEAWPQLRIALTIDSVLLAGVMLCFAGQAHYGRRIPFWNEFRAVIFAGTAALLGNGFVMYSLQRHDSRLLLVLTWALFPLFVMAARAVARRALASAGLWQIHVVVVGDEAAVRRAADALHSEPGLGYRVAATVSPPTPGLRPAPGVWRNLMRQHRAELLVLAHDGASELAESLMRDRVPLAVIPKLDGLPVAGFERTSFLSHDTVLFTYGNNLAEPVARATKVAFDVGTALAMLLILAPVLLIIAAAVALDGGPVLYSHTRIGVRGRLFGCLKFRSMMPDSDEVLRRLLNSDPAAAAEWAETQKLRRDPRITAVGRWLRATSLDELPQLLNILRLDMSLVGPRPIVQAEVPRYGDDIAYYFEARPGLTGLWQVSGRSDTGYDQRVRLDTWYVKNWSIWHDLAILAKTVPAVLRRRGAV